MNLFKTVEKNAGKLKWYDFSIFKLDVFFFTLFLITAWAGFRNLVLSLAWYWYLIVALILMIPLLKKFLK